MLIRAFAAIAIVLLPSSAAFAQSLAEFYRGKSIELYIAYSAGGGYDLYARMLARHLGRHIPGNPQIVPKNMEGAGGLRLANWPTRRRRATARRSAPPAATLRSSR
jgi:tripartite-type tricarboxylate transporter receptor subunit TctC